MPKNKAAIAPLLHHSMIQHADHMYAGEEAQVAQTIAKWADTLVPPEAARSDAQDKR